MCLDKLLALFRRPKPLAIPHPEEPENPLATLENVSISDTLDTWIREYQVPILEWDYWGNAIVITVRNDIPYPAQTYEQDGIRHLEVKPGWLNPGVIAHEQAHNSYSLLTAEQRTDFSTIYTSLKTGDPLIVFLYSKNPYGLTNDVEGHAEVYRYLGSQMPAVLRPFYQKLF